MVLAGCSGGASETATTERAAVNAVSYPLWPFLPFQPATMSLVGCRKRWGRKGALGERLVPAASEFRQETSRLELISHEVTIPESDYAPPVISESNLAAVTILLLQKSVLPTKFVVQYGFALNCRSARERSKKTEAVSAMQTQPAVCIARGGTKRQNKKPCCARLRFVSFDSDEV